MALDINYTQDALYQLGYQAGLQEARAEIASRMLKKGLAFELIGEITGLSAERIAQLGQQPEAGE